MKRFYLKATASVCYDYSGVTYPTIVAIPFKALAPVFFKGLHTWEREQGWTNQPEVLCFTSDETTAKLFERICNAFYPGFIVRPMNW